MDCDEKHQLTVRAQRGQTRRTMAFSNEARVMMSRGLMSFLRRLSMYPPTESHSSNFSLVAAGLVDEPGSAIPMISAALAMVL